jgi:hypothetical protein
MPTNTPGYMRNYRATAAQNKHQKAVREGVALAVKLLRMTVGQATVTGVEAALMVERTLLGPAPTSFTLRAR